MYETPGYENVRVRNNESWNVWKQYASSRDQLCNKYDACAQGFQMKFNYMVRSVP